MFFAHENMKKPASKVAEPAQIQPKSQFLIHKNLPPQDFSLMTLIPMLKLKLTVDMVDTDMEVMVDTVARGKISSDLFQIVATINIFFLYNMMPA